MKFADSVGCVPGATSANSTTSWDGVSAVESTCSSLDGRVGRVVCAVSEVPSLRSEGRGYALLCLAITKCPNTFVAHGIACLLVTDLAVKRANSTAGGGAADHVLTVCGLRGWSSDTEGVVDNCGRDARRDAPLALSALVIGGLRELGLAEQLADSTVIDINALVRDECAIRHSNRVLGALLWHAAGNLGPLPEAADGVVCLLEAIIASQRARLVMVRTRALELPVQDRLWRGDARARHASWDIDPVPKFATRDIVVAEDSVSVVADDVARAGQARGDGVAIGDKREGRAGASNADWLRPLSLLADCLSRGGIADIAGQLAVSTVRGVDASLQEAAVRRGDRGVLTPSLHALLLDVEPG